MATALLVASSTLTFWIPRFASTSSYSSIVQSARNFPHANEELWVFYLNPAGLSLSVSQFIDELFGLTLLHTFQDPSTGEDIDCAIRFQYDSNQARVMYNARQVLNYPPPAGQTCTCTPFLQRDDCYQFHRVLAYGYHPNDDLSRVPVVFTECSELPLNTLIPYFNELLAVSCSQVNCQDWKGLIQHDLVVRASW